MNVSTMNPSLGHTDSGGGAGRSFDFSPWTQLPPMPSAAAFAQKTAGTQVGLWERLVALVLLIVLLPLFLLISVAVLLDSPGGPAFYQQERVGLDRRRRQRDSTDLNGAADRRKMRGAGQQFQIWKFRTMVPNAELHTGPIWAADGDLRVTRVGRVLRYMRLDELPQFFNVLCGQMRLIGPRPERPHFVRELSKEIPEYPDRLAVPPGITGLAQIEQEYDTSLGDVRRKLRYDLFYVQNRCGLLDMKILIKTIDVVLRGRGAR